MRHLRETQQIANPKCTGHIDHLRKDNAEHITSSYRLVLSSTYLVHLETVIIRDHLYSNQFIVDKEQPCQT